MKIDMSLRTLKGHPKGASSIILSKDGRYLISGGAGYSKDKSTIKIWVLANGNLLREIKSAHSGGISSLALSPDGKYIISSAHDKTIKLWDMLTGMRKLKYSNVNEIPTSIVVSPDGKYLFSGFRDGTIRIWQLISGRHIFTHKASQRAINSITISVKGKYLISGSDDGVIVKWKFSQPEDLATLIIKEKQKFIDHEGSIWSLAVSHDGNFLASGGEDNTIKLWDFSEGILINTLKRHPGRVYSVIFSPNDKYLISGSAGRSKLDPNINKETKSYAVRVWTLSTGELIDKFEGHTADIRSVLVTKDERYLISAASSIYERDNLEANSIKIWDFSQKYTVTKKKLKKMDCPQCKKHVSLDSAYCPNCGFDLKKEIVPIKQIKKCKFCGSDQPITVKVCEKCGNIFQ